MALSTYSELQTSIAGWLSRADLTARIPDFITLVETRLNRKLRVEQMETVATGTLTGQTLAIPADCLKIQRFVLYPGDREIDLEYAPAKNLAKFGTSTDEPFYYTKQNQLLYVAPIPDSDYTYKLFYLAKVAALSDAAPTNWLLTDSPDVYLYGALLEAAPYIKNDARIAVWAEAYKVAMNDLTDQEQDKKHSESSLVVRSDLCL